MNEFKLFGILLICIGFLSWVFGVYCGTRMAKHSFKRFTDEMHKQYLYLLQKHGIKVKS